MQITTARAKRSKGMAIILTTLSMSVLLPLVGLGFDVSTLYLIKSKLNAATDSAALAGARALSQGADPTAQTASAKSTAQNFFNANFPSGYWRSWGAAARITVDDTSTPDYRVVTVTATTQAPLYFLRVLNQQASTLNVSSTAGRRDVVLMMVLDRSSSMNGVVAGTGQTACAIMKTDAAAFVNYFAPGRDRLGLVVFGSASYVYPSTTSFTTPDANGNTMQSIIGQINCGANTASAEAMAAAYRELTGVNDNKRMNVVVFMTDGRPNGITGQFTAIDNCATTNGTPLQGVLAQWAGGAVTNGQTAGLMQSSVPSITSTDGNEIGGVQHCAFSGGNLPLLYKDIADIPATDIYGNLTSGPYSQQNSSTWPYTVPFNPVGATSIPQQIVIASTNALDNEATQIRTNTTLNPFIYDIALEGDGPASDQPDTLLLRKMANDPSLAADTGIGKTFYQQQINQPHGYFAEAPDASQLAVAFNTIATQISIRLAH